MLYVTIKLYRMFIYVKKLILQTLFAYNRFWNTLFTLQIKQNNNNITELQSCLYIYTMPKPKTTVGLCLLILCVLTNLYIFSGYTSLFHITFEEKPSMFETSNILINKIFVCLYTSYYTKFYQMR